VIRLSKSLDVRRRCSSLMRCVFVSTRLRRLCPFHPRRSARPRYFAARKVSFRAMASAVMALHGFGIPAGRDNSVGATVADCILVLAGVVSTVCGHVADLLAGRDMIQRLWQDARIADMVFPASRLQETGLQPVRLAASSIRKAPAPRRRTNNPTGDYITGALTHFPRGRQDR
jgi:hypothetical protein